MGQPRPPPLLRSKPDGCHLVPYREAQMESDRSVEHLTVAVDKTHCKGQMDNLMGIKSNDSEHHSPARIASCPVLGLLDSHRSKAQSRVCARNWGMFLAPGHPLTRR